MIFHRKYLDALAQRVLVHGGVMGSNIQKLELTAEDYGGQATMGLNDYLTIVKPSVIDGVHRSFLEAGVDVIITCTFRGNRITLGEYGLRDRVHDINLAAARIARKAANDYATPSKPRFVIGSIGPSGKLPSAEDPVLSNITFEELADIVREQAVGLIEGGSDVLLLETAQDLLELKAGVFGLQQAFVETGRRLPIQAQVTLDTTGRMLLGTDISAVTALLERLPVDLIGINCSTGPEHMREPVRYLGEHSTKPVSVIPNAGVPLNIDGRAVYTLEPELFARELAAFVDKYNVNVVGGCCGITPAHLKRLVELVGVRAPRPRPAHPTPEISSAIRAINMRQDPAPLLIGERLNAQGSRKVKELLLAEDFDALVQIGRAQVEGGAHALDVCAALTERTDEPALLRRLVHKLAASVDSPLVIDSTEPAVIEAALKAAAGRCIINSINLEGGRKRIDSIVPLAKAHGAALIALTIDEQGMAKTADRKLAVARRILDIVTGEFGLAPEDLIFDLLTFTLATGEQEFARSAIETLEGIRRVKAELPGVFTSLGVSNISFGLAPAARAVINSIFLYHCVQAGLDMAIVNPAQITPYADIPAQQRELAEDLIFARREDALAHLIAAFEGVAAKAEAVDASAGMPLPERIHWRVVHRKREHIEEELDALVRERLTAAGVNPDAPAPNPESNRVAVEILNTVLLTAMKEVGDLFGRGELILPFVLQSAEVMKHAVNHLERYLERAGGVTKGKLVLATVYGDVHDIGKNLVKTILANNGFTVIDLGKQVPVETIVAKAAEENADAIGLSALLVSTSRQMPLVVQALHRRGAHTPVLIGGAAINRSFSRRILFAEENEPYAGGVFYCKDAFEGLDTMERLRDPQRRAELIAGVAADAADERNRPAAHPELPASAKSDMASRRVPIPIAPAYGAHVVRNMPLLPVFECLDRDELFRLSWGAKNAHGAEWERLRKEFSERLEKMQRIALSDPWLKPQGVYGYFPAQSDGDDLVIYDPASIARGAPGVLLRFSFPRQAEQERLCLADYFAPADSGVMDLAVFQVVTVGREATARFERLQAEDKYTEGYYLHGLAVQTAEAAAEYLHRHIRRELGLPADRGKRYSWGYPAIPSLEDHRKVFDLLPAERELGMSLTPAFQLLPEQSTAAIVVHHPEARYFLVPSARKIWSMPPAAHAAGDVAQTKQPPKGRTTLSRKIAKSKKHLINRRTDRKKPTASKRVKKTSKAVTRRRTAGRK
jgi:5-methyltetrahydrofolate--homocysteine methyltransferase